MLRAAHWTVVGVAVGLLCGAAPATRPTLSEYRAETGRQAIPGKTAPDIDAAKLVAQPYDGLPAFSSFRSFMSSCYASADVWVYADGDDQKLYDTRVGYQFPKFYRPTWGELFDHVARQMRCRWEWNPAIRQFKFCRSDAEPFFSVKLADGWRREDRGMYVWHAPIDQPFGMDIYYFGHFTASPDAPELERKVREHVAVVTVSNWPVPPTVEEMKSIKLAGVDALYHECDTPRPGSYWRQWSLVVDGHAFLIVSAMPKERMARLAPQVDEMLKSFKVQSSGK